MTSTKSLAEILAQRSLAGVPIPVPITLSILRQVSAALDYAHNLRDAAGQPLWIVHRDVSPRNILVGDDGRATLVASSATHAAYAYMAPECVTTGMLDARADLFGLGVIAHEMLANRPLFATGDDRETLDRVCTLPIPPPSTLNPQVAPEIDGIVLMALARDPAYRWQHAAMIRDGLAAVAQRLGMEGAAAEQGAWLDLLAEPLGLAPPPPPPVVPAPPPGDPELWADDTNLETRVQPVDPRLLDLEHAAAPPPEPAPEPAPEPTPRPRAPAFEPELGPEPTQIGAMPLISFGNTPLVALIGENARQRPSQQTLPPPVATFVPEPPHTAARRRNQLLMLGAIVVVIAIVVVVLATR